MYDVLCENSGRKKMEVLKYLMCLEKKEKYVEKRNIKKIKEKKSGKKKQKKFRRKECA